MIFLSTLNHEFLFSLRRQPLIMLIFFFLLIRIVFSWYNRLIFYGFLPPVLTLLLVYLIKIFRNLLFILVGQNICFYLICPCNLKFIYLFRHFSRKIIFVARLELLIFLFLSLFFSYIRLFLL